MPSPELDPQRLAALLDGKLGEPERAKLLAQLEASPDDLDVLADAAAALVATGIGAPKTVTPIARRPTGVRRMPWTWGALAAAAVIAVAIPAGRLLLPPDVPSLPDVDQQLGSRVDVPSLASLPATRGAESTQPPSIAIRLGVALFDLTIRERTGDAGVSASAARVATLLRGVPAGSAAALIAEALAQSPTGLAAKPDLRDLTADAETLAGARGVRSGYWLAAARMAATHRDTAFFASRGQIGAVRAAVVRETSSAALGSQIDTLSSALNARPVDWSRAGVSLDRVLLAVSR